MSRGRVSAFAAVFASLFLAACSNCPPPNDLTVDCAGDEQLRVEQLIQAIASANGLVGGGVVTLERDCVYTLREADNGAEEGHSDGNGLPVITNRVVVQVAGVGEGDAPSATVQRAQDEETPSFRIFEVAEEGELRLKNLTVQGGQLLEKSGGGISAAGSLIIEDSTLANNRAGEGGGGIYSNAGVTVKRSNVIENDAGFDGDGGGIAVVGEGTLNLVESRVADNVSSGFTYEGGGGLLFAGTLAIVETTVFNNNASISGGGALVGNSSIASFRDVTFSNNKAVRRRTAAGEPPPAGGGLQSGGNVRIYNSTFSNNESYGIYLSAGSLQLTLSTVTANKPTEPRSQLVAPAGITGSPEASLNLRQSLVASQTDGVPDCAVDVVNSAGYNLDSDESCRLSRGTDLSGADPQLRPLANNGGALLPPPPGQTATPTFTHALNSNSPALHQIPESECASSRDQRGVTRPQAENCDIGAFELEN